MIHASALTSRVQDDTHAVVEQPAGVNVAAADDIVFAENEQVLPVLIGEHGGVGNHGRLVLVAHRDPHADAGAGDEPAVGILGHAADQIVPVPSVYLLSAKTR